ncbi:MAG: phosphoglycerate kinase, partial [bacterium]|nr:phosphoglycerate kinase [bacterium]
QASLPTIKYLVKKGCRVIIISHLGRPEGPKDTQFSLEPVASHLAYLLGSPVHFVPETFGDRVKQAVKKLPPRGVMVLENLRFHKQEEANDHDFAERIVKSTGAQYFVQDGFGVVHRAHASTDAVTELLPSVAGLLLEKEYTTISDSINDPERPLLAIMGGAKVSDKIQVIEKFVSICDQIVIGGAMANTFLAETGDSMGASKVETDQFSTVKSIKKSVTNKQADDDFMLLPTDVAVAKQIEPSAKRSSVAADKLANDDIALDIGDATITDFKQAVAQAKTIIWNGTLGYAEIPAFAKGSAAIASEIVKNKSATSIIGGGDTADFVRHWDSKGGASFSHVSTGGGASLDLMAGKKLPGIEALLDARA